MAFAVRRWLPASVQGVTERVTRWWRTQVVRRWRARKARTGQPEPSAPEPLPEPEEGRPQTPDPDEGKEDGPAPTPLDTGQWPDMTDPTNASLARFRWQSRVSKGETPVYEIDGMSQWDSMLAGAKGKIEEFVADMRRFAAAGVGGSPVHQAAREHAETIAAAATGLVDHVDQVHGITRQADAELWRHHVDNPDPNHHKWVN